MPRMPRGAHLRLTAKVAAARLPRAVFTTSIFVLGLVEPAFAATPTSQPPPLPAQAMTPAALAPTAPPLTAETITAAAQPTALLPALTPVKLEITNELSTKTSKEGDTFPLRLAEPIIANGIVVVPAGTEGMGEVIESKHGGMGGGAGVLILAARYLVVDGRHLRLRSMHMAQSGRDNRDAADAIAIAGGIPGSFIGFLIPGGGMTVAAGTIADAKTAEDFQFGAPAAAGAQLSTPLAAVAPAGLPPAPATVTATQTISKGGSTK